MKLQPRNRLFSAIVVKMRIDSHYSTTKNDKTIKLSKFIIIGLLLLTVGVANVNAALKTWDRGAKNDNWASAKNWYPNGVPTSSDDVVIPNNSNVTVNTEAVCASFTINGGKKTNAITISGTNSLTVTNAITIYAGSQSADNKYISVGAGTLSAGSVTMANTGNDNRDSYISVSTGTINVSGNITMNGSADRNQIVFLGAGTLNIGGTGTITGGTISSAVGGYTALTNGTVNYNGSTQTVGNYNYYHLTLSGSNTKTLQNGASIGGNLNIGDGTSFTTEAYNLTVTGTTTIGGGSSGNLTIGAYNGTKIFTGLVTINAGGTWNNSASSPVTFRGGITNNGTFTAGNTYTYTFDTKAFILEPLTKICLRDAYEQNNIH